MKNKMPYVIGIAGGSASGKTSILKEIERQLPENTISIISQDNYYFPLEKQIADEQGIINFDLPSSINREKMYEDLTQLIQGKSFEIKEYTFNNPKALPKLVTVHPAPIIIIEGLFVFHYQELNDLLNLRVFIDVVEDIKLNRRIKRDANERGYPEDDVRYQWHNHVMPAFNQYLKPYKKEVDIIITNNTSYKKGLEVLVNHLSYKISGAIL
jgi:uridine kinase